MLQRTTSGLAWVLPVRAGEDGRWSVSIQSASGSQPVSATRSDSDVVVKFAGKDGRLSVYDALDASSFELCSAEATAVTWVRFCRGDSPLCNLYDGSGLPIGPFEFDIE